MKFLLFGAIPATTPRCLLPLFFEGGPSFFRGLSWRIAPWFTAVRVATRASFGNSVNVNYGALPFFGVLRFMVSELASAASEVGFCFTHPYGLPLRLFVCCGVRWLYNFG